MIVVAVVGILAALALPSFFDSIRKGRRSEAVAALAQVQQAQERWRANNATYADNAHLTTAWPAGLGMALRPARPRRPVRRSSIDAANATGYTASATAVSGTLAGERHELQHDARAPGRRQYPVRRLRRLRRADRRLTDPNRCWSR